MLLLTDYYPEKCTSRLFTDSIPQVSLEHPPYYNAMKHQSELLPFVFTNIPSGG